MVEIEFSNFKISNEQADTFAYNIFSEIGAFVNNNFEDFFIWSIEDVSKNIIMTLDGIICIQNMGEYEVARNNDYEKEGGNFGCSNLYKV